jgi:hypothetical protein
MKNKYVCMSFLLQISTLQVISKERQHKDIDK